MSAARLRDAVPGLAAFVGALVVPTIAAWLRLMLEALEGDRGGLQRPRRWSSVQALSAVVLTALLGFFTVTLVRAAGELRELQSEAPVVGTSLGGFGLGLTLWVVYAAGWSALRRGRPGSASLRERPAGRPRARRGPPGIVPLGPTRAPWWAWRR